MTENIKKEEKASKNETCECNKTKNIEKIEFTNKCNTLKRKHENISMRSKFNKNLDLTTSVLTHFNLRNEKIAPILNSCIKEILLRTNVNVLEMVNTYYTKG